MLLRASTQNLLSKFSSQLQKAKRSYKRCAPAARTPAEPSRSSGPGWPTSLRTCARPSATSGAAGSARNASSSVSPSASPASSSALGEYDVWKRLRMFGKYERVRNALRSLAGYEQPSRSRVVCDLVCPEPTSLSVHYLARYEGMKRNLLKVLKQSCQPSSGAKAAAVAGGDPAAAKPWTTRQICRLLTRHAALAPARALAHAHATAPTDLAARQPLLARHQQRRAMHYKSKYAGLKKNLLKAQIKDGEGSPFRQSDYVQPKKTLWLNDLVYDRMMLEAEDLTAYINIYKGSSLVRKSKYH